MRLAIAAAAVAALAAATGVAFVASGLPDVAATTPHWAVTEWVAETTMQRSVQRRAGAVAVPDDLDEPSRLRAGARAYADMCEDCHAGPGARPRVWAEGLLPAPPELAAEASGWSAAELFWLTKHGVRMTGMPAFGPTHADAELWDVVAAVRRLPGLSPAEYAELAAPPADAPRDAPHDHDHAH